MSKPFRLAWIALLALPPSAGAQDTVGQSRVLGSDEAQVFLQAFQAIKLMHASGASDSALWVGALEGLLGQIDDPYATVFTPTEYAQFQEGATGRYAGIGVQIAQLAARVTVTAVFRGTPAERAGMLVGDRIVWVEGHDATDWSVDQARDSIRGEVGTVVRLRVERDGLLGQIPMELTRDSVHVPSLAATWIDGGVAYFGMDRIARGSATEVANALSEFAEARALILDLRGNPGGYLAEALGIADLFLAPGELLAGAEGRNRRGEVEKEAWTARSPGRMEDTPIVVLVDGFTASAAEIISGALQDHDRAVVVGSRTFGKGAVQSIHPLPAGRWIRLTTGSWITPLGRSLHRPRNRNGEPKEVDESAMGSVTTGAGRELGTGGGVVPDIAIVPDAPLEEERALYNHAIEVQVPLGIRIREYALDLATTAMAAGAVERLPSSAFDGLVETLVAEGMDSAILGDPVARAYLEWSAQVRYLDRAEARGLALLALAERDRALAEALRLARSASTPDELFALADAAAKRAEMDAAARRAEEGC